MEARQVLIAPGHPNRPGDKLEKLLAIVIHYTANPSQWATAEANSKYFGRKFVKDAKGNPMEADGHTPFAYGSAQVIADENEVILALPTNEVGWAVGDSRVMLPDGTKAQQPLANKAFKNRQNRQTVSIEICNNGDWDKAVANAKQWAIDFIREKGLIVDAQKSLDPQNVDSVAAGTILVVRHHDLTGKMCPQPFIDNHDSWVSFVTDVASAANDYPHRPS